MSKKLCTFETATKTHVIICLLASFWSFFPLIWYNVDCKQSDFLSDYENGGNVAIAKHPFCWFLLLFSLKAAVSEDILK